MITTESTTKSKSDRMPAHAQHATGRWDAYALGLVIFLAATASAIVLYGRDSNVFLYFGDAVSHLSKARQFFDSRLPGIHNIGTVWLPLPHLLLLPFVLVDELFFTGIAGPIVGIPLLTGTGVLLFFIVRSVTGSRAAALLSASAYALNPNVVYMALTPMNEPGLMFFLTLGGFALLRWVETDSDRWLFICSLAAALACLCRYEAWLSGPFVCAAAVISAAVAYRRTGGKAAVRRIAAGFVALSGIALWLFWNQTEYGDALKFAHWTYSAAPAIGRTYLRDNPRELFSILSTAVMWIFGPVVFLAGAGALVRWYRRGVTARQLVPLLYFALPPLFTLGAIIAGFVQVDQWWWNWRYVLPLGLFLAVAGGEGVAEMFEIVRPAAGRIVIAVLLLAMPFIQLGVPSVGVATYRDAIKISNDNPRFARAIGEQLREMYAGGSVALLTGFGQAQRIMISSRLPLRTFHILYDPDNTDWQEPLWNEDRYLIISKDTRPESAPAVEYWLARRNVLLLHYTVRSEDDHYLVMER
jgi:hypothetical protein